MANVTTIDVTTLTGSDKFPLKVNDVYGLVETIASQNIRNAKSTNRIEDGFYNYDITDGSVIEEAIFEMAKKQAFVKTGAPDLSPKDPILHVKYFNNWEQEQFKTTTRFTDIRTIIANKGVGFDDLVAEIIDTLTQAESDNDYENMRAIINNTSVGASASETIFSNREAKNSKGIIYCARQMYNAIKATNSIGGVPLKYGVPVEDIRIAISESALNLIDVTELANVFNLSKEELFGKLVVVPYETDQEGRYMLVYDVRALGRGTRLYQFSQDVVGAGLYTNHYLTTDRIYFYNPLYKCLRLDIHGAMTAELNNILQSTH